VGDLEAVKLLLDTHILLWSLLEPSKLTAEVAKELDRRNNELWISPISTWEIILLAEKGKIILDSAPETWLRELFKTVPFKEALINHEVAIWSRTLSFPHQDPADRFLAAAAVVYDLILVTADEKLMESDEYKVLPNRRG
jgi:PIN domain nuclease of toxin-antitoxin system